MESGSHGRGHALGVGVHGTCLEVTRGGERSDADGTCLLEEAYLHCIHRNLSHDLLSSDPGVMAGTFLLHSLLYLKP